VDNVKVPRECWVLTGSKLVSPFLLGRQHPKISVKSTTNADKTQSNSHLTPGTSAHHQGSTASATKCLGGICNGAGGPLQHRIHAAITAVKDSMNPTSWPFWSFHPEA